MWRAVSARGWWCAGAVTYASRGSPLCCKCIVDGQRPLLSRSHWRQWVHLGLAKAAAAASADTCLQRDVIADVALSCCSLGCGKTQCRMMCVTYSSASLLLLECSRSLTPQACLREATERVEDRLMQFAYLTHTHLLSVLDNIVCAIQCLLITCLISRRARTQTQPCPVRYGPEAV